MSDIDAARAEEARRLAVSTAQAHVTKAIDAIESVGGGALTDAEQVSASQAESALRVVWVSLERRRTG